MTANLPIGQHFHYPIVPEKYINLKISKKLFTLLNMLLIHFQKNNYIVIIWIHEIKFISFTKMAMKNFY